MIHNKDNSFDSIERGISSDIQEIQRINESKIRTLESQLKFLLQNIEALEKTIQEIGIRLNVLKSEPNSDGLTQVRSQLQTELDNAKRDRLSMIRTILRLEEEYSNLALHVKVNHDAQLYKPRNLTRQQFNDAFINVNDCCYGRNENGLNRSAREELLYYINTFRKSTNDDDLKMATKFKSELNFLDNYFNNKENQNGNSIFSKIMRFLTTPLASLYYT